MATIKIQVVQSDLEDLGVNQRPEYVPLTFKDGLLWAYWIGATGEAITVYIGSETFICEYTKSNIELFKKIIDGKDNG